MADKPFIKKFETRNSLYIYDVNSSEIIRVSKRIFDLIDEIGAGDINSIIEQYNHLYSEEEIRQGIQEIEDAQRRHQIFLSHRPAISSGYRSIECVRQALENHLSQVILELTTSCNLRCKYCEFSDRGPSYRRLKDEDMPPGIAFKAIEYFLDNSNKKAVKAPPAITVYGGEPLLRFDLLKEILAYTKKKGLVRNLHFNLTTNGTLLTDEIIEVFVDFNVSVLISLDGPRKINDRFRVFPGDRGAFDSTLTVLERIKRNYPTYFREKISVNSVLSPPYPFDSVISFFSSRELFEPILEKVSMSLVDKNVTEFFRNFDLKESNDKLNNGLKKMRSRYSRSLIQGSYDRLTLEKSFFLEDFYTISRRKLIPLKSPHPAKGACLPGQRRLFVNTKGKFYMCEKVGSNFEIGDVERGLDFEKIFEFLSAYDDFFRECGNCWALRLCKKCFNDVRKEDRLDEDRKKEFCKVMLQNIEANLITYCEIIEENPHAFDVFKDVVMA